jgi:hypothetical protein
MDLMYWFYIFLAIVFTSGGSYSFYIGGKQISAGIFFVGALAISIFFGLRWFPASGSVILAPSPWKPVLNYCPDFLTLTTINSEKVCVDTIGVTYPSGSTGLSKWTGPSQTDEKYLFHLFTNSTGQDRIDKLCAHAKEKKVTWEGVWDGYVCIGGQPPLPP